MKKSLVLAAIGSMVMTGSVATAQKCAHDELIHAAISNSPAKMAAYEQYSNNILQQAEEYNQKIQSNNTFAKATDSKYTIPLAFHVMLTQAQLDEIGGTSGLYNRIQSQVAILNTDFNALNTETIPDAFKNLKGNPNISFGVAHTNPNGLGTTGVEI